MISLLTHPGPARLAAGLGMLAGAAAALALAGCGTQAATTHAAAGNPAACKAAIAAVYAKDQAPQGTSWPPACNGLSQAQILAISRQVAAAQPAASPSAPATPAPLIQAGVIMPPAGYAVVLHAAETGGMPASSQAAGVDETWRLNSVNYISYAQSQEGQADSVDVAQQIGANEPLPSDQFAVLGVTVTNAGTEPDTSPVISGGTFYWVTPAGKTGQTAAYSVGVPPPDSSAGVLAPYVTNAKPTQVNSLNPGQSITGYMVLEVPDSPSAILVTSAMGDPGIELDPLHLIRADICSVTAKSC